MMLDVVTGQAGLYTFQTLPLRNQILIFAP